MPVVEPTPHARKRALVRRGTLHSISSDEGSPRNSTVTPPPMPQMPKKSGTLSPLTRSYSSLEDSAMLMNKLESTKLDLMHSQSVEEDVDDTINLETFKGRPKAFTLPSGILRRQINWLNSCNDENNDNSDRRGSGSSTGSDVEPRRLSSICPPDLSTISEAKEIEQTPTDNAAPAVAVGNDDDITTPLAKDKKEVTSSLDKINDMRSGRHYTIYNKYAPANLDYDLEEYEEMAPSMLQQVLVWDFAIDQLEKDSNGLILSRVSILNMMCIALGHITNCRWPIAFFMKLV